MLTISGALIYKMTVISLGAKAKYPVVSCAKIGASFDNRVNKTASWLKAAQDEYAVNKGYEL